MSLNFFLVIQKVLTYIILVLIYVPSSATAPQSSTSFAKIIDDVASKYKEFKSLSMTFTKEATSKNFATKEKTKGKILIKGKNKFRLDSDQEQIISEGGIVWIYSKENNQVTKNNREKIENIFDFNQTLDNFSNTQNYYRKHLPHEKIFNINCYLIELAPWKSNEFITKFILWIETKTFLIRKIEYFDINDNHITLLFNQISPNARISDKKFDFQIPAGVELVDLTDIK